VTSMPLVLGVAGVDLDDLPLTCPASEFQRT
jgi:hypothetical protein